MDLLLGSRRHSMSTWALPASASAAEGYPHSAAAAASKSQPLSPLLGSSRPRPLTEAGIGRGARGCRRREVRVR